MEPIRQITADSATSRSGEVVRIVAPLLILACGVVGFVLFKDPDAVPARPARPEEAPRVDTVAVTAFDDALTIHADGQVVPYQEAVLSAEVLGRVVKRADVCRAGRFVKKGELLVEIDPSDYLLEKRRLEEEREQANVTLAELDVELADTESLMQLTEEDVALRQSELNRQLDLVKSRATGASVVDEAKRNVLAARNSLATLRKQANQLKARKPRLKSAMSLIDVRLEQAELNLKRTKITSPIDGIVVDVAVEENGYVQIGTPLVTIEDTSAVEIACNLRMDQLAWIWRQGPNDASAGGLDSAERDYQLPDTPVTVVFPLGGVDYTWRGVLWRYDGVGLDERTRTIPCRVLVTAPRDVQTRQLKSAPVAHAGPPALVRGMFVALEIHAEPRAQLYSIPESAVQPGDRIWTVRNGALQSVDVRIVETRDGAAVVRADDSALQAGDRVVISPLADPLDGTVVRDHVEVADERPVNNELARAAEKTAS